MANLGVKLFYLRTRERRLSQQEAANSLGVRQATLSHLERGNSHPNHDVLRRVCEFFDVTPTWLLDDERGVVPRPTERWSLRNALVTVGMHIECGPEHVAEVDAQRLVRLAPGAEFYDEEAAELRRSAGNPERARELLAEREDDRAREEERLLEVLQRELREHPRRRARIAEQHAVD